MAELIYNATLTGFTLKADSETVYEAAISSGAPAITSGEVYTVVWNGKKYVCAADNGELGNKPLNVSGIHTDEPFLYVYNGDSTGKIFTTDNAESHTISIYKGIDNPDGYLVYDRTIPFIDNDTFYGGVFWEAAPVLVVDNTYTVIWDGKYFVCKAEAAEVDGAPSIVIGNKSLASADDDTEEPFLYAFVPDYGMGMIKTTSTESEHTVSIYNGVLEESNVIFENQEVSGFALQEGSTMVYEAAIASDAPVIVADTVYTVTWDGARYACEAENSYDGEGTVAYVSLGSSGIWYEPFRYRYNADGSGKFETVDTDASHFVEIYEGLDNPDGYLMHNITVPFAVSDTAGEASSSVGGQAGLPELTEGNKYTVIWDGAEYICEAKSVTQEITDDTLTTIYIGNRAITDSTAADTGEPFLYTEIILSSTGNRMPAVQTLSTETAHVISIYNGVLRESRYLMYNETLEGFALTSSAIQNSYGVTLTGDNVFSLALGKNYIVVWDGIPYTVISNTSTSTAKFAGNLGFISTDLDSGEPFLLISTSSNLAILTTDTATSHTVSVYQLADQSGYLVEDRELSFAEHPAGFDLYVCGVLSSDGGETWIDAATGGDAQPIFGVMPIPEKIYTVTWDGTEYVCTSKAIAADGELTVYLGNSSFLDGDDTGEPFLFVYTVQDESVATVMLVTVDTSATHTISVYAGKFGYLCEDVVLSLMPSSAGLYLVQTDDEVSLIEGATYTITLNGTEYECIAQTVSVEGMTFVFVGNASLTDPSMENTGEPFVLLPVQQGSLFGLQMQLEESDTYPESCTVSIYAERPDDGGGDSGVDSDTANVVLYNSNGRATTYYGIKTVTLNTDVPNETETFSLGTAPDETKVELDLSGGNQVVENTETHLLKKVVIQKPASLTPENIKKGVEIAGVEGDLIGEGVSKEVELSLAEGDQNVEADPDTLMSNVLIKKPETLLAENIKKGVEIAGVEGELVGEGVSKEVELNLADGDQTVEPDQDTLLSEVIIKKPDTLLAENIKNGVEIAGVSGSFGMNTVSKEVELSMAEGDQVIEAEPDTVIDVVTVKKPETLIPDNIAEGVDIGGVVGTRVGYGIGDIAAGTISGALCNESVTTIRPYAFYSMSLVTEVSFPNCTSVGSSAFCGCSSMTNITFPACTYVGYDAFYNCAIKEASFPLLSNVNTSAFRGCSVLEQITIGCNSNFYTTINNCAFSNCYNLSEIKFMYSSSYVDGFVNPSPGAFYGCSKLKSIQFLGKGGVLNTYEAYVPADCFKNCYNLSSWTMSGYLGRAKTADNESDYTAYSTTFEIEKEAFANCSSLTTLSFTISKTGLAIASSAFANCINLQDIWLNFENFDTSDHKSNYYYLVSNAFYNTPISKSTLTGTYGSIHITSNVYSLIRVASGWRVYSARMVSY